MPCSKCGTATPLLINGVCPTCFVAESPIIDEAWRIVKDVLDNRMEWEDSHEIERRREWNRTRRKR